MPDEKNDVVDVKKYNEVIEAHNSVKTKLEKVETELRDLQASKQKEEIISEQKKVWESERNNLQKQIEDTNKKIEDMKKDNSVVSKGIVNQKVTLEEDFMNKLDKVLPNPRVEPKKFASKTSRLMHYKAPLTKQFSHEDLGKGLSLHATAQKVNPALIPPEARQNNGDLKAR